MKIYSVLLGGALLLLSGFLACENANNAKTQEARERLSKSIAKSKQEKSNFSIGILAEVFEEDPQTGTPKTEINLISPQFPEHLLLARDFNYFNINKKDWASLEIPQDASLAFRSNFKGRGSHYYLKQKEHVVELMRREIVDISKKELEQFSSYRTIDLANRRAKEGTYICFQSDEDETLRLSVYFSADAKARAMKYEGKNDWTHLIYNTSELKDDGPNPSFIDQYYEYYRGKKFGLFNLRHSGDWDYIKYSRLRDAKEFNFTIDHETTLVDGAHRRTPCFEE